MPDSSGTSGRKPYPEKKKLRIQKYPDTYGRGLENKVSLRLHFTRLCTITIFDN